MKTNIIISVIALFFLWSCSSSSKQFKKGNYDKAISIATKKLRGDPSKEKEINILLRAYKNANSRDNDRISLLKKGGQPEVWEEIYNLYNRLKARQSMVESAMPLKLNNVPVNIPHLEYDDEIVHAKKRAAEYLYVHATKLYESNNIYQIRSAYEEFIQVKRFYHNYKNVDEMIIAAKNKGTSNVYVKSENHTHFKLPNQFVDDIVPKNLTPLSSKWVEYYRTEQDNYDYLVSINLVRVKIAPELLKEELFTEKKTIRDGWEYQLDRNGNVMKDTLGNDIKNPKYTDIFCAVSKTKQRRDIKLFAEIIYKDLIKNRIVKNIPITTDWFIENIYATANGDFRALSPENKKLLKNKPIRMPNDIEMIMSVSDILKKAVKNEMQRNKRVIK